MILFYQTALKSKEKKDYNISTRFYKSVEQQYNSTGWTNKKLPRFVTSTCAFSCKIEAEMIQFKTFAD